LTVTYEVSNPPANLDLECVALGPSGQIITHDPSGTLSSTGEADCFFSQAVDVTLTSVTVDPTPSTSPSPSPSPSPTLSINQNSVVITQAVNNFTLSGQTNVTLVQGKSAAIIVPLGVLNPNPNDQTPVTVVATMPDGTTATSSPIPMASIGPNAHATITPISISASDSGNITLQASASDAMSGSASVPIMVKQTNPLGIVYVPFVDTNCTGTHPPANCVENLRKPAVHKSESDAFIQNTYPIASGQVTSTMVSSNSTTSSLSGTLGVDADILSVALTRTISNSSARNGVGIVPSNANGSSSSGYFSYHYPGANTHGATIGVSIGSQTSPIYQLPYALFPYASLVEEGWWPVTAHEIAHTFGASDTSGSVISNGFNVQAGTSIPSNIPGAPTVLDFMGASGTEPPFSFFQTVSNAWITPSTYGNIFSGDLTNPSDPQVLVLSGIISQNGTITLNPAYFLSAGYTTSYSALANGVVNSLGSTGAVLSQSSFLDASQLLLMTDDGRTLPLTETPFLVQVPFSQNIETLQIVQDGKTITSLNPNSQLLVDAFKEIPSTSFIKNPTRGERDLLKTAEFIESSLKFCQSITSDKNHDNWLKIACTDGIEEMVLALRQAVDKVTFPLFLEPV
jgi:hypothetical protein